MSTSPVLRTGRLRSSLLAPLVAASLLAAACGDDTGGGAGGGDAGTSSSSASGTSSTGGTQASTGTGEAATTAGPGGGSDAGGGDPGSGGADPGAGGAGGGGEGGGFVNEGGGKPDWLGPAPTLTNDADGCEDAGSIGPAVPEFGHRLAARLTPPSTPYTVTHVHYEVQDSHDEGALCDINVAHSVEVYVLSEDAPPASPSPVATIAVPEGQASGYYRLLREALPEPITLEEGQHLFVSVEMAGVGAEGDPDARSLCVGLCAPPGEATRNYWSNAAETPYDWMDIVEFGFPENVRIAADGFAGE